MFWRRSTPASRAVRDLENALGEVLNAFRTGKNTLLTSLLRPRIDKILFAATKADHLNHVSHDRLEAILRRLTARAIARSENVGAVIDVVALAAVRATHEVNVGGRGGAALPAVVGIPIAGERIGGEVFDGRTEAAIFPGELPRDPDAVFSGDMGVVDPHAADYRFVRFRPPIAQRDAAGAALPLPHIRLDRALQFLLGDRFDRASDERFRTIDAIEMIARAPGDRSETETSGFSARQRAGDR